MFIREYLKVFAASLLLFFLLIPFGLVGIDYRSLVGTIACFLLTIYFVNKYRGKPSPFGVFLVILAGQYILTLDYIVGFFRGETWSLPYDASLFLGTLCGYFFSILPRPVNILTLVIASFLSLFLFFQGWDYWLHKRNYGTFTGKIEASLLQAKFEAFDESSNLISDFDLKGKIVLLDFWNTRCSICFEKFPQLQAAFEKYKNDPSVAIYAVDKPIEEDKPGEAFQVIKDEGYSFPVVIAKDEDLPEKFGVKYYPTTFVIDRNGMIVYRGDIAGAVRVVDELKEFR